MKRSEVSMESFRLIGIKTRTTNAAEMSGEGRIASLWNRFFSEGILAQIPGKMDQAVLAVYHHYESDAAGAYDLMIGAKVAPGALAHPGMDVIDVPAQKYFQVTTGKGEMPGVVVEAWQLIWGLAEKSELSRRYTFDFEIYDERAGDPRDCQVDVCIAVHG